MSDASTVDQPAAGAPGAAPATPPSAPLEQTQPEGAGTFPEGSVEPSPLDTLRSKFAEAVTEKRLYKILPARNGCLIAEYQPVPLDEAKKAMAGEPEAGVLVSSLTGIWVDDKENPAANKRGLVPLGLYVGQPQLDPLSFDKRLTDLLGIPFGSAQAICLSLFEGNDLALSRQAAVLGEWSVETHREGLQDFAIAL